MLCQSNRMHDAVVWKLIAASRGSPCDSMASCYMDHGVIVSWQLQQSSIMPPSPLLLYVMDIFTYPTTRIVK